MTIGKALCSSVRDPYRQQATPASRIKSTNTSTLFVGPAEDWGSHRTHCSDVTSSPT